MKRYAFIDVPNTTGTTKNCLDFEIDWGKLYKILTNEKWRCSEIFFYKGYKGDKEREQLKKIEDVGYKVRTKLTHIHPDRSIVVAVKCESCKAEFPNSQTIKGHQKSNCDVELTVDALDTLSKGDEALIFTGDGDFAYLVENLISKGVIVWLVSSKNLDKEGNRRFSTRISTILNREELAGKRARFIHINNWKEGIKKT